MNLTRNETRKFQELANLLSCALAELDPRGTDETVSNAMRVVHGGFESALSGKKVSSKQLYHTAIRRLGN